MGIMIIILGKKVLGAAYDVHEPYEAQIKLGDSIMRLITMIKINRMSLWNQLKKHSLDSHIYKHGYFLKAPPSIQDTEHERFET